MLNDLREAATWVEVRPKIFALCPWHLDVNVMALAAHAREIREWFEETLGPPMFDAKRRIICEDRVWDWDIACFVFKDEGTQALAFLYLNEFEGVCPLDPKRIGGTA